MTVTQTCRHTFDHAHTPIKYMDIWHVDSLRMRTGVCVYTWKWNKRQGVTILPLPSVRWWWWGILVFLVLGAARLRVGVNVCRRLIGIRDMILNQIFKHSNSYNHNQNSWRVTKPKVKMLMCDTVSVGVFSSERGNWALIYEAIDILELTQWLSW